MSVESDNITAILVTRGDHNDSFDEIVETLPKKWEVIIWDNSGDISRSDGWADKCEDLSVYGRYAAIECASNNIIYIQDDDCIVDNIQMLVDNYIDGEIIANMPQQHINDGKYFDSCLVGWGALFRRDLPRAAFDKYQSVYNSELYPDGISSDDIFNMTCDVIFTSLTPYKTVDAGHTNFDFAYGNDRMYNQGNHNYIRGVVLDHCRIIKGREKYMREERPWWAPDV